MIVVPILLFALAAVVIVVGGLATLKKLPGNSVFGLRVHEARKSPEAWITAHAVAGPVWLVAGASLTFGALVSLQASGFMWVIPAVTTVVGCVAAVVAGADVGAALPWLVMTTVVLAGGNLLAAYRGRPPTGPFNAVPSAVLGQVSDGMIVYRLWSRRPAAVAWRTQVCGAD